MNKNKVFLIVIFVISINIFCADKIRLLIPDYKPYTYTNDLGELSGIGVKFIKQIMDELKIDYTITQVNNYQRVLQEVKRGAADGFFLASKNNERDEVCVFSEPVIINKWGWCMLSTSSFNPNDSNFKKVARIGTILNTNTHIWLKDNKYNITSVISDTDAPPKLLKLKRVDAFFLAELVFWAAVSEKEKNDFKTITEIEQPFGIYISKEFLKNYPGFMEKINAAINKIKRTP